MRHSRVLFFVGLLLICVRASRAQQGESYGDLLTSQVRSGKLDTPAHLSAYVVDGKLRLSVRDAVVLTLENNSQVRVQEASLESSKFTLLGAHAPFDPVVTASYNITSSISPPYTLLQGTGSSNVNFKSTTKYAQLNYSQTFQTGINVQAIFNSFDSSSNNSFFLFNPYVSSTLSFQFTQPLLRNGWFSANQAPLIIARRNLQLSRATFSVNVNDSILEAITQYWAVVQAKGNLDVARASMDAAEATYKRDKRALELGALPPMNIYRSESQVASRRVQVIQSEYAVKEAEDTLRLIIGADQDPLFQTLDLELTERPEPIGELLTIDAASALQKALATRPEFDAARAALARDETQIRLAHNHLLPQLDLMALYASNGVGGATGINGVGQPVSSSWVSQLFGFGFPMYEAQLSLSLPIKNRAAKAEMGSALVARRSDLYGERLARERVQLDIQKTVHQLEQAKLSIVAGKEALDLANKALVAEQRKYELGSEAIFLLLEAQTEVATAQQILLTAEVSYQLAVAAVDHATGELLEPYHIQIGELTH